MRLFVAIDLPTLLKRRVHKATTPLRKLAFPIRWLDAESLHITLKFLGEVRPQDRQRVEAAMARAAAKTEPFETTLQNFGAFPSLRRPRVVWAGVDAVPGLRCLKQDLEWEFRELGYEREMRAFQPHVTLGRIDPSAAAGQFRELSAESADLRVAGILKVKSVVLMRSDASPKGQQYDVVSEAKLGRRGAEKAS